MKKVFYVETRVTYVTADGRRATGSIDRTSLESGRKLYRVDDQWFVPEALFD